MRDSKGKFAKGHKLMRVAPKRDNSGKFAVEFTKEEKKKKQVDRVLGWNSSPKGKAYKKKYLEDNRERLGKINLNNNLIRKYGITVAQKAELTKGQNYLCAICKEQIDDISGRVDHDHLSGNIRGILCHFCNTGLGLLRDNIEILNSAILYLKGGEK